MATAPGHGAGHPSVPCPQLPPAPPVPSVVALTLPPNPAFPQPESKNLRIILQSIRGQATVLEVQRWGCASLRDLAQESAEDRSWLGRLGGIELVLNAMRTFQSDTELQQCACGALATLSYENQANTSAVLQHGGVELLLRAMHAHSSTSAVQGLACYVLRILAAVEEGREHMVQLGGIETILVALQNHIEDVELQASGCGVLGRLTACSSEDLATVSSSDGLGVALRGLSSHPDDSQVQACASALLGNLVLAGSNSVQEIAGSGKAAQLLVHALGHQASEVQSCAISALNNMCLRSEDCIAQAAVSGAYAPLATTFEHQDERGQLFAITVLYLLAMQDKGDVMDFVRLQGLSDLIPIMMHFMSSLKVQEQISSILQRFGSRPEILDEILYHGGLAGILTAMHRFPMSPRIQVSGCFLTAHWARSGPDKAQRVAEAGGVELVAAAMHKHLTQVDVQVFGCMMLQAVADQVAESPQAVAHFGGVEAVLQSLKRHREDGHLQEMAVQALCSLGRQDQICRIKVVEYGLPKDPSKALSSKEEPVLFVPDDGLRGKKVELWTLWGRTIPQHEEDIASLDERNDETLQDAPPEVTEEPAVRGVQLLFRALLHPHGEVASVLHSATCSLLAHIAGDGKEYQAHVLEEGGIVAATRCAHMHASDPQVQVDAFHLLLNLVGPSEGPSALVQMATAYGAVELIMQALRTYPEHKAVLRASAKLIRSLVLGGDCSASESTLSRNFEDRITNFDGFAEGLRVDTFLQELRRYSADVATRCTAQGVVEIFMKSLSTFAADAEMKEVILVAYRELAANRRSRHRMTMRGTWKEIMAEVKAHQDHPTLQVFGCDLMELQTRDCEHANIEDAIVFGGIESLLKVFKNHAQNLTVQERSCVAAAKLASRSPDIKAMFIEGHLIQMMVDIMAWHRGSENLQKVACVVLLSLADHSLECRSEMVSSNCLEAACAALQEHPVGVTDLQAQALMLMASLGGDGAEVRSRLADADGLLLSLHAMEASIESFEAQMEGCHLLTSWGRDDPQYFQLILDSDRLVSIISGMQRHVKQRRVQEEFAELLRCLAMHSQDGKDKVIAAGGIEAILDGMNANRKSDELAYRGCASMAILAKGNQAAVARIAKHDGAKHIVRAMLVERERADLQESALEAIRAISADDEEVPAQIASNGGVQFVVQALTDFKDYEAIQEHGLAALANLAWDSADNQLQIGELEGCEHAIEVLALHSENPKVQAFGCALLQSVACNNPEMRTRIGEIGGVEAIVQAMKRDLKAANVQAFGASALQSLAMHNQDNVRRCHKLKVVDFVADAMEAHPYSLKLREFGEMLINTIEG